MNFSAAAADADLSPPLPPPTPPLPPPPRACQGISESLRVSRSPSRSVSVVFATTNLQDLVVLRRVGFGVAQIGDTLVRRSKLSESQGKEKKEQTRKQPTDVLDKNRKEARPLPRLFENVCRKVRLTAAGGQACFGFSVDGYLRHRRAERPKPRVFST